MIPMPTPVSPEKGVQLAPHQDQWALATGEAERIPIYREKGDVATLEELRHYLSWLWSQPILSG